MTSQFAIAFATTLVENKHLVTLDEWNNYFKHHFGTFHSRSTYCYFTVVVNQQHFLNLNSCAGLHILHVVNVELLALFNLELLTLNFCNYVHLFLNCLGFHR